MITDNMKIYHGICSGKRVKVTVDGLPLSMKCFADDKRTTTFSWGDNPGGAEQLALSLLADCLSVDIAEFLYTDFVDEIIGKLDKEWEITSDDIEQFYKRHCAVGYAAQTGEWTPIGSGPTKFTPMPIPFFPPDIIRDPNYRFKSKRLVANKEAVLFSL